MNATTHAAEQAQPGAQPKTVTRTCPNFGHHTLIARGQYLHCRSCEQAIWRSES